MRLRDEHLVWRDVEGEIVILDLRSSRYLQLNSAGAALWRQLAAGADEADLVSGLVQRFAADANQARDDVAAFLDDLRSKGYLGP